MRRRAFLSAAAGATTLWSSAGIAQPKIRTVGVLDIGSSSALVPELRKALAGLGYVEGKDIRLDVRSSENSAAVLQRHADELVAMKVDVIVTRLTPPLQAAKAATLSIPIVMTATGGPVEVGLIASLARPGGNITGMSLGGVQITGKRLQLIHDTLPALRRLVVISSSQDAFTPQFIAHLTEAGRKLGIETTAVLLDRIEELDGAFAAKVRERPDAIQILANLPARPIIALAARQRVPLFATQRDAVVAGALMSYSGRLEEQYRGAAVYIDKIFKGAAPATLPAAEPSRFEMVINLKTADALGLSIPANLLVQADDLVE
jgi:putative tryptophan/tyrosine transport system substrate-binding protein